MDNSNSIQSNSALPDPDKEKFEQEEQKKYEQWKTQQEGGEATGTLDSEIMSEWEKRLEGLR